MLHYSSALEVGDARLGSPWSVHDDPASGEVVAQFPPYVSSAIAVEAIADIARRLVGRGQPGVVVVDLFDVESFDVAAPIAAMVAASSVVRLVERVDLGRAAAQRSGRSSHRSAHFGSGLYGPITKKRWAVGRGLRRKATSGRFVKQQRRGQLVAVGQLQYRSELGDANDVAIDLCAVRLSSTLTRRN